MKVAGIFQQRYKGVATVWGMVGCGGGGVWGVGMWGSGGWGSGSLGVMEKRVDMKELGCKGIPIKAGTTVIQERSTSQVRYQ